MTTNNNIKKPSTQNHIKKKNYNRDIMNMSIYDTIKSVIDNQFRIIDLKKFCKINNIQGLSQLKKNEFRDIFLEQPLIKYIINEHESNKFKNKMIFDLECEIDELEEVILDQPVAVIQYKTKYIKEKPKEKDIKIIQKTPKVEVEITCEEETLYKQVIKTQQILIEKPKEKPKEPRHKKWTDIEIEERFQYLRYLIGNGIGEGFGFDICDFDTNISDRICIYEIPTYLGDNIETEKPPKYYLECVNYKKIHTQTYCGTDELARKFIELESKFINYRDL